MESKVVIPLHLMVAGHTNVGKTSLMRTLGRKASFGRVENAPGTTQHVEALPLGKNDAELLILYDTPGLEDAMALREFMEGLAQQKRLEHWQGVEKIQAFLNTTRAHYDFQQEAKVLRQLMQSDAVLFVVDVRTPVLQKYFDELALLQLCGKPILPVLNFTQHNQTQELLWRQELKRVNLHSVVAFDACSPPVAGEFTLYQTLATLLGSHENVLRQWQALIKQQMEERWQTASEYVAELIINAASFRLVTTEAEQEKALGELKDKVRVDERKTAKHLLTLYGFVNSELQDEFYTQISGRWQQDLFHPATLQIMGVKAGKGLATGAALGAGFDVATGGLSLGLGTVLGATLGASTQAWRHYGSRLQHWWGGKRVLTIEDALLSALILRLYLLIGELNRRGHGAGREIRLPESGALNWQKAKMPAAIEQARAHPEWCAWGKLKTPRNEVRQTQLNQLAVQLRQEFFELLSLTMSDSINS